MNKEAQEAFEKIKTNVLDRSIFEDTRPAFMKDLLPKIAPDFDWDNFYYFGSSYGNESIILCFRPETEYFDIPLKTLDPLYLNLIEEAASIKGAKIFKAGSIKTTYSLVKNLRPDFMHKIQKHRTLHGLVKWFNGNFLLEGSVGTGGRLIHVRGKFSPPESNWIHKTFFIPNNATLEELGAFLYLNDRLPTRSEAEKWYNEKVSKRTTLEDR